MGAHRNEDNQSAAYEGVDLHSDTVREHEGPQSPTSWACPSRGPLPKGELPGEIRPASWTITRPRCVPPGGFLEGRALCATQGE